MTYDETEGATVTVAEARAELRRHGWTWRDLQAEDPTGEPSLNDEGRYDARAVVTWLGY